MLLIGDRPRPHFIIETHGHEEAEGTDGSERSAGSHNGSVPKLIQRKRCIQQLNDKKMLWRWYKNNS